MTTVSALRQARTGQARTAAGTLCRLADQLEACGEDGQRWVGRLDQAWSGDAHQRARARLLELRQAVGAGPARLRDAARALERWADAVEQAQRDLAGASFAVGQQGFRLAEDGKVSTVGQLAPAAVSLATAEAHRLTGEARRALEAAGQADVDAATALAGYQPPPLPRTVPALDLTAAVLNQASIPSRDTDPAQVRRWWESLTPEQRRYALERFPDQVGALDGVPCVYRDEANRAVMAREKQRVAAELAQLRNSQLWSQLDRDSHQVEVERLQQQLAGIAAVEARLGKRQPPAFLLGFDTHRLGHAIVAVGNPDEADNVVTYVPGTFSRLGADLGEDIKRADSMFISAKEAASAKAVSAIVWVGYDAPQAIGYENPFSDQDAMNPSYALAAGERLDRFQDGLRATHDGTPSRNTVLGHSYGSTVVGFTARDQGLNADSVIFLGSPGVGVEHASELRVKEVWASNARYDPVGWKAIHGPNPTEPDFAGRPFSSDPGTPIWGPSLGSVSWIRCGARSSGLRW